MDLSEQIALYEKLYPSVPVDAKPGTRVVFHGHGGYPNEQDSARKVLTVGHTYTLAGSSVGNWHSTLFLEEADGGFNSSMFSPEGWTRPEVTP